MFHLHTSTTMKLLPVACLCLLTRCGKTSADENGPGVVRVAVEEGGDVVLPCSRSNKENVEKTVFDWKKDGLDVFFYEAGKHYNNGQEGQSEQFKGRVFHFQDELKYGNASIRVQKTKMADSGNYTCTFPKKQTSHIMLFVDPDPERSVLKDRSEEKIPGAAPEPYTKILPQTDDGVLLQCEVRGVSPEPAVEWRDGSGNKLPAKEPQVSERESRFYITLQVTVTKTDNYRCVVTQEEIKHQISAETFVPLSGAASTPSVTTLDQTNDWSLLQCEVQGASPEPAVEWRDGSGNKLPAKEPQVSERGGSYDIILQTTVTKTDNYHCVVTQETIHHQTRATTYVHFSGATSKPSVTILDFKKDQALLQCEVQGASPEPAVEWRDGSGDKLPAKEPQVSERGGSYDIILQTTVTKTDNYHCVATQETIHHQTEATIHIYIGESNTGWIVAVAVLSTLYVGVLLALLREKGYISRNCLHDRARWKCNKPA
ncbi:butyrophilin-like protein 2 isoform X2 [Centropristis striata]|uniref:butyrophilin-like protein 2 isoform X2 n=1 Tax=Centropristis striata TaxID=184440 RepID=UPI0027E04FFE|nr:butyrophilin-like protein 2 isoform X2 [Centropristis striata]